MSSRTGRLARHAARAMAAAIGGPPVVSLPRRHPARSSGHAAARPTLAIPARIHPGPCQPTTDTSR
jgi:hypothetical protein